MSEVTYTQTTTRDYKEQFRKKAETASRRASTMCVKVFQLKIQENKCNEVQEKFLNHLFIEAKWYYNDCVAFGKSSEENKPWKNDYKKKSVVHYDKDKNPIESEFQFLSGASKQEINKRIGISCKSLSANLKHGNIKHTKGLQFKSEFNSVPFRQFNNSWKFKGNKIKLQNCSKPFKINGLEQLQIDGIEFANANLIQKASGYYIQITCYVPKEDKKEKSEKNYQTVGLDFGCENTLTGYIEETNQSFKLDYGCEQPEKQIRVQRKISRRRVRNFSNKSNTSLRLQKKNKKYYEHQNNQKKDRSNKIIHDIKDYGLVIIQDGMLSTWQKGGHGKAISSGILGRLKTKIKKLHNSYVLDSSYPTSKFCFDCFHKNRDLKLWNRTFVCTHCGSVSDRDVHDSKNIIEFYHLIHMVPTEIHRDPKRLRKFVLELLSDIEKSVEMNPSRPLEEVIQLASLIVMFMLPKT